MNQNQINEVADGKRWFEESISFSRDFTLPERFGALSRRVAQLRCASRTQPTSTLKALIKFSVGAAMVFVYVFRSRLTKAKISTPFSIWDSNIEALVTCEEFLAFARSGQIPPLKDDRALIVKSKQIGTWITGSFFCRRPVFEALLVLDISAREVMGLLSSLAKNFVSYLRVVSRTNGAAEIWKDFLTEPLIDLYRKKGLQKFYRTNADFSSQEFWCENLDFHTVWYATNTRALQFKDLPFGPLPENPFYYFMYFGASWTWNERHANWLKTVLRSESVHCVGPIMLYVPPVSKLKVKYSKRRLLIFDVIPFEDDHMRKHVLPRGFNCYNESYCIAFISGIMKAFEGQDWEIRLKSKRDHTPGHSARYIQCIDKLEKESEGFQLLSPRSNIYDEIEMSDLVITIPFSSPYEVAKSIGIPSIYFDPEDIIDFAKMGFDPSEYAVSRSALRSKTATF